jgi:hypothetical protein
MPSHEPLIECALSALRPTQMTVGMAEVAAKRFHWSTLKRAARARLLAAHWFPAIKGPKDRYYIVDHHHLAVALGEERVKRVWVMQLADLSSVSGAPFWQTMEFHRWSHPYDRNGKRSDYGEMPSSIDGLRDDPYRSLAGSVRNAGGYAKDTEPYAEFLWAEFFRARIDRRALRHSADGTLTAAVVSRAAAMAHGDAARYLPGWSGTSSPQAPRA